jgi:hypothetical protein
MTDAFAPNAALQKFGLLLAAIALIPIASLEHACPGEAAMSSDQVR